MYISTGYGPKGDLLCDDTEMSKLIKLDEDECDDENDKSKYTNKSSTYKSLKLLGESIRSTAEAYWKIYNILSTALYKLGEYKKLHIKICRILEIFDRSIINSVNIDSTLRCANILRRTIVMSTDIAFFQFARNLLIDQLKSDKFDQFSIERILISISTYFIEHSNPSKPYINIHELATEMGIDDLRVTIMFFIYILGNLLCSLDKFEIPLSLSNSISIPLIVGMTMRSQIKCPTESSRMAIVENIITNSSHYDQLLFTRTSVYENAPGMAGGVQIRKDKFVDQSGNSFIVRVDESLKNVIECIA